MSVLVDHDSNKRQFFSIVDGLRCILDYELHGTQMTITHTVVPESLGGRGIAGALTQHALDHARASGWKVVPACSYAAAYFKRHPQYADLLA